MDTLPSPSRTLRDVRGEILALDLVRDWAAGQDLVAELDSAMRALTDPTGGLPLHTAAQNALTGLFEDELVALDVPPHDPASRIPTARLTAETDLLLTGTTTAPEICDALAAFAVGDFAGMVSVPTTSWFVVVGLAAAAAGRVRHGSADAYLTALERRRTVSAAL
ncbi:hypothetical protein GCM10010363_69920 [Streptomyces omiyaensis]|uniref:hypothetical protein n=1 Tax=Streptomyces omiyaensis TaxID=68247 RepID=UPI001675A89A|nr:hypothetical protein [Streptomyces omiyaensis]GGY78995.1 hypothetical protein GCM10010363_69920 [Streptomyces omiyaensis]